jgi:hypothetical protein
VSADGLVLGAGMTGVPVGIASGLPVYEAADAPGGICASYYVRPGEHVRLPAAPADGEAYHFEIGGGHWLFGGDPAVLAYLADLVRCRRSTRVSSVFFHETGRYVPYPIQNHLRHLDPDVARRALAEMSAPRDGATTMREWLCACFGPTLAALFFDPFHQRYTAGLWDRIAPQDAYKSPVDLALVRRGAEATAPAVGYNATFLYPEEGLDRLAARLAARATVHYGKRAVRIDLEERTVQFADGDVVPWQRLVSTLPLNRTLEMAGLSVDAPPDPFTSVLVLNLGAARGPRCPDDHWLYHVGTRAGFHRVGFYSNVDPAFLPRSARGRGDRVAIYVERAFPGGTRPTEPEVEDYALAAVDELRDWGFIGAVEVLDPTWVDVAYTWAWPGSRWREQALARLADHGVHAVGRYGRWVFQGIADSIRDGLALGRTLAERRAP